MKKLISCFYLFLPILFICQDSYVENKSSKIFELKGKTIFYDGYPKTYQQAKIISEEFENAFYYFEKAKKIKSWNVLWVIIGSWQTVGGTINGFSGNPIGWLDAAIGGGLFLLVDNRKQKIRRQIQLGIKAFNDERLKEIPEPLINYEKSNNKNLNNDRIKQLFELKKLLDAGILTKEEFDKEKNKILNQ